MFHVASIHSNVTECAYVWVAALEAGSSGLTLGRQLLHTNQKTSEYFPIVVSAVKKIPQTNGTQWGEEDIQTDGDQKYFT